MILYPPNEMRWRPQARAMVRAMAVSARTGLLPLDGSFGVTVNSRRGLGVGCAGAQPSRSAHA